MDEKSLRKHVGKWPGVTEDIKWDNDLIFSVGGKMFCGLSLGGTDKGKLSFKVESERFLEITDRPQMRPAPYMARAHWVTIDTPGSVDHAELLPLLRRAYELVREKLPKKTQRELAD
jgi:predicted DNA-binding protein (MmcQ/YjbR family)